MMPIRMSFELNLMNLGVISKKDMILTKKWNLSKKMLDFNPVSSFELYLEF